MKRYCELSVHGLVATAFFALAMTGRIDLLSIAIFTPALAVSLYRALESAATDSRASRFLLPFHCLCRHTCSWISACTPAP